MLVWLIFGAGALQGIEYGEEKARAATYCQQKTNVLSNFTSRAQVVAEQVSSLVAPVSICRPPACKTLYRAVGDNERQAYYESLGDYNWRFPGAFLFCLTCISTIGYGNYVPITAEGKLFTIAYTLFGIGFYTFANVVLCKQLERDIYRLCRKTIPIAMFVWSRVATFLVTVFLAFLWILIMASTFSHYEGT